LSLFRDLGFSEVGIRAPEKTKAFLYISQKRIVGLLLAEAISKGYKMVLSEGERCLHAHGRLYTRNNMPSKEVLSQQILDIF
jgi:hypothetical protein